MTHLHFNIFSRKWFLRHTFAFAPRATPNCKWHFGGSGHHHHHHHRLHYSYVIHFYHRLGKDKAGGAWCPSKQLGPDTSGSEWIQVDLDQLYVITGVATQGRFGKGLGQEFTEWYNILYSRERNPSKWIKWKSLDGRTVSWRKTFSSVELISLIEFKDKLRKVHKSTFNLLSKDFSSFRKVSARKALHKISPTQLYVMDSACHLFASVFCN